MKIIFDDKGYEYIEIKRSKNGVYVVISAKDANDSRKTIVNSAELTREQLFELISDTFELNNSEGIKV